MGAYPGAALADPAHGCIISQKFQHFVQTQPQAVAVVDAHGELTYAALAQDVARLAARLQAEYPDLRSRPLALTVTRTRQMVIGVLAMLASGASLAPLDPVHPAAHKRMLLQGCGAHLVLGDPASLRDLEECGLPLLPWLQADGNADLPPGFSAAPSAGNGQPVANEIGFIIHTSGSTGQPKGVQMRRAAMLATGAEIAEILELGPDSRLLHYAALGFDAAMLEVVLALCHGAQLHIVPEEMRVDVRQLARFLLKQRITHAVLPAAILPYLPLDVRPEACPEIAMKMTTDMSKDMSKDMSPDTGADKAQAYVLQHLVVAGDVANQMVLSAWAKQCRVWNGYGPAEITVCASMTPVSAAQPPSLEGCLPGVQMRLCNEQGEDADEGEIWLGGSRVAAGYCNAPQLNEGRFVQIGGVSWYKTGDLARRDAAGRVFFLGRSDDQVKIGGNRVETGMLEALLRRLDGVQECVVLACEPVPSNKQLVAWLVVQAGRELAVSDLQQSVLQNLPAYYLPQFRLQYAALPLTPNGKTDRNALRRQLQQPEQGMSAQVSVRSLFCAQLGLERIGADANFFELGGNSIALLRLLHSLQITYGDAPSMRQFYQAPTVAGVERYLREQSQAQAQHHAQAGAGSERFVVIAAAPAAVAGRLTPQQSAIWYLHQQYPHSKAYLAEAINWFEGRLEIAALETALNQIFARHSIYRTVFKEQDGEPWQFVQDTYHLHLPLHDASQVAPGQRQQYLADLFATHLPARADLSSLPLANFLLVRFAPDLHALLHQEHHLVHDGWGGSEFSREMLELYAAQTRAGYLARVQQDVPQYLDFAATQARFLQSETATEQRRYWQQQLAGAAQGVDLFGKRGRSLNFAGGAQKMVISRAQWQAVEQVCRQLGISIFSYTLAVLMLCLSRYSGQKDIPVGSAFAARSWSNSASILGMLVNTIVLRQQVDEHLSMQQFLLAVQQTVAEAQAHQELPFAQVVQALNPARSAGVNPFFNVLLGFHDNPIDGPALADLRWRKDETVQSATSKFDLDCLVIPRKSNFSAEDEVHFLWEYRSEVFSAAEIALFLQSFGALFTDAACRLSRPLAEFNALSQAQYKMLMQDWGRGPSRPRSALPPWGEYLQQSLAAQPTEAVALRYRGATLSYGELCTRARQLAERMRSAGVGPGTVVALEIESSPALVVAMLAVFSLQAVAVVLALDLPAARREWIAQDANPALLITLDAEGDWVLRSNQLHSPAQAGAHAGCAYILYTSGSTGVPKGVLINCSALLNVALVHREVFALSEKTVAASLAPPSFDAWMMEVWPCLLAGGSVVLASAKERGDLQLLAACLHDVQHVCFATGLLQTLCESDFAWPPGLLTVLTGGDRLGALRLPRAFRARLFNMYGPTETTVDALMYELVLQSADDGQSLYAAPPPLGTPIANLNVRVYAAPGLPAVPGAPGELYIGGAGVARGYLQPGQNAERFIELDGEVFYRSGDLVRWNSEGQIEFLGRVDDEVKIRGYRIAPGEIESCLRQHPALAQAVVLAHADNLYAFLTLRSGAPARADGENGETTLLQALKQHLQQHLPPYMQVAAYKILPELPLSVQGKFDRQALRALLPGMQADSGAAQCLPETPLEQAVAGLWQEVLQPVLNGRQPSCDDNFFALGGHSLLAMKLGAALRSRYAVAFAMQDFFQYPTIRTQARYIAALQALQAVQGNQQQQAAGAVFEEGEI